MYIPDRILTGEYTHIEISINCCYGNKNVLNNPTIATDVITSGNAWWSHDKEILSDSRIIT